MVNERKKLNVVQFFDQFSVSFVAISHARCMEIIRVTPGNQPLVRADCPRFSSDCLMIALHLTKPTHRRPKLSLNIIRPNYPASKLSPSAAKIITHLRLPRQLSLTILQHFPPTGSICLRPVKKSETGLKLSSWKQKRFRGKAEPQESPPIDTAQCLL